MGHPEKITLYAAERAPMVHPVLIALYEKSIKYDLVYINPYDKPDSYRALTPTGQGLVPLLVVDEERLFESTVINEFLDEVFAEPRLLPTGPVVRAKNRAWALQAFDFLMAQAGMMIVKNRDEHELARQMFIRKLAKLEAQIGAGPFFNGDQISLTDCQYAPILVRQEILDRRYGTKILPGFEKLSIWTRHLIKRPSVQATLSPAGETASFEDIFLPSFYDSFLTTQRAGRLSLNRKSNDGN
jgi:glutathione S-transferase